VSETLTGAGVTVNVWLLGIAAASSSVAHRQSRCCDGLPRLARRGPQLQKTAFAAGHPGSVNAEAKRVRYCLIENRKAGYWSRRILFFVERSSG
jgi:hypothetical protein